MTTERIKPLLPNLKSIAREAGAKIMDIYANETIDFSVKKDQSPVSIADLAAHHHIVSALAPLTDYPIVSEEDADSFSHRNPDAWFWIIDPLDGTKEFLNRNGEFTVNIALVGQGISQFGIVYAPAIDLMYWGGKTFGAHRTSKEGTTTIQVSDNSAARHRVVASKNHLNDETKAFIEKIGLVDLIQSGSSLKFCRIAEGAADIYPRLAPTCEWDTAAAQAVLEGAGGYVVNLQNEPLRYGKTEVLNPSFIATRDMDLIPS